MATYRWRVDIIESEAGWGQKVDDVKFFDDEDLALAFVADYNKSNTAPVTPSWYMRADPPRKVMVDN